MTAEIPNEILTPLREPLTVLPGIGPRLAALLAKLVGGATVRDVLFHLPTDFLDRRASPAVRDAEPGVVATLRVQVFRHEPPGKPKQPWRVVIGDDSGFAEIVLFHAARLTQFPVGARLIVSGKLERFGDRLTMPHPDYVAKAAEAAAFPWIEPIWPLAAGITPRVMRLAALGALAKLPELPEWHEPGLLARRGWPGFGAALRALQAPAELPDRRPAQRLGYDELLARQIAFAVHRRRRRRWPGAALRGDGRLRQIALGKFGHELTGAQARVLAEIDADLEAPHQMLRLLQGDVGSGKTLVALLAMLRAVEAGRQAALLAPTEVLARQHAATFARLCPVRADLLTGNVKGKARSQILRDLEAGALPILIGTHAIFQKHVGFARLGLAVIDEQHRFGVDQRLRLGAKGEATDLLVMTATPIPRTLLLTHWGDMDVSRIEEKPPGRMPITTTLHKLAELERVRDAVDRAVAAGGQVFWVCPLVRESEVLDVTAAELRYHDLRQRFGAKVVLAHGRQEPAARERAMRHFAAGLAKILVATTVIEVGVDVAAANVMVIEHAERFGLAQLHQLRGRIGRGAAKSYCLLLHDDKLTVSAARRLSLLRETEDGFRIADEDYRQRGAGEHLGTRQSGQPDYRLADAEALETLQVMARQDAELLLRRDPRLQTPRGQAVRLLLNLFEQRDAIDTVKAG